MYLLAGLLFDLLVYVVVDVLLYWTGEILRFVFTLGRRKPVFRFWAKRGLATAHPLTDPSLLLGLCFWAAAIVAFIVW